MPLHDLAGIVLAPTDDTVLNILASVGKNADWSLPDRQVLLSGDGHYWITLDYRKGDVPSVAWIDVECDEDIQVARTFAAFLKGLRPDSDFE